MYTVQKGLKTHIFGCVAQARAERTRAGWSLMLTAAATSSAAPSSRCPLLHLLSGSFLAGDSLQLPQLQLVKACMKLPGSSREFCGMLARC